MGTSERQLFRAQFAWLCRWLLSDVCGGGCFTVTVVSARTPPRPTPVERVSGDLADSTRQLVRDTALLLLLCSRSRRGTFVWVCPPWRLVVLLLLRLISSCSQRAVSVSGHHDARTPATPQPRSRPVSPSRLEHSSSSNASICARSCSWQPTAFETSASFVSPESHFLHHPSLDLQIQSDRVDHNVSTGSVQRTTGWEDEGADTLVVSGSFFTFIPRTWLSWRG